MNGKMKFYVKGILLGICGKPILIGGGEPEIPDTPTATHYLYGHVAGEDETPDVIIDGVGYVGAVLPGASLTSEENPFALIAIISDGTAMYCIMNTELYVTNETPDYLGSVMLPDGGRLVAHTVEDGAWIYFHSWEAGAWLPGDMDIFNASELIWTNTDIYREDGTLFMAASEPVPVYDTDEEEDVFPEGMTGIVWDGNTEGLYVSGTKIPYYLVSDNPLPVEDGMNCVLVLDKDGVRTTINTEIENANVSGSFKIGDYVRIYNSTSANYEHIGTYLRKDDSGFVAMVAYPIKE